MTKKCLSNAKMKCEKMLRFFILGLSAYEAEVMKTNKNEWTSVSSFEYVSDMHNSAAPVPIQSTCDVEMASRTNVFLKSITIFQVFSVCF